MPAFGETVTPTRLFPRAHAVCEDRTLVVLRSMASAWAMHITLQLGKQALRLPLAAIIARQQQTNAVQVLPIAQRHVLALQDLPAHHKETTITHDFAGQLVATILQRKKASIKQAPLPSGSPDWTTFLQMTWEEIEEGARLNRPGFRVVRKLLTDKRFYR